MARIQLSLAVLLAVMNQYTAADNVIPTIVINASRSLQSAIETPAAISFIDRQAIEESGARNVVELLRSRAGLHIRDLFGDGSNATMDLRGFGPTAQSNTLILVDGRRLNNSADIGSLNFHSIDLAQVERVEIIQGSAGTLFGNQAVGGVVNIISRQPVGFSTTLTAGLGSFNSHHISGRVSDRLASDWTYSFSVNKRDSDNYRDHNDLSLENVLLRVGYEYRNGSLFAELMADREHLLTPGALFQDELAANRQQSMAIYQNDFSNNEHQTGRFGLAHRLTPYWRLEGEWSYRDDDREFVASARTFAGSQSSQDRWVRGFSPRFIGNYPLANGDLNLILGTDWDSTDYRLVTAFGPQAIDQDIQAIYGQLTYPLAKGWTLTTGVRHADVKSSISGSSGAPTSVDDSVTVGSIGLSLRPNPEWRLFGRIDQNYRFPKVDEHANVLFGQPIGLSTQTGRSYETGIEFDRNTIHGKVVFYRLDLTDEISFDATTWFNINLAKSRRRGAIIESEWIPTASFSIDASYSYVASEITHGPFRGHRLPLVPEHNARVAIHYRINAAVNILLEAASVGDQILGSDFSNSLPVLNAYNLVNLQLNYQTASWKFAFRANNLFNEVFSETGVVGFDGVSNKPAFFPAPERNFWVTASLALDRS